MKKISSFIFVFILISLFAFPTKTLAFDYSPELFRLAEQGDADVQNFLNEWLSDTSYIQ